MKLKIFLTQLCVLSSISGITAFAGFSANGNSDQSFTCVKSRDITLADLKKKLTATCNLDKPFSITATDTGLNSSYTFCCHAKLT